MSDENTVTTNPGFPKHPEQPPGEAEHAHEMGAGGNGRRHEHGGHDKHAGHSVEMFRTRFWVSLVLTIPTIIWGHMLPRLVDYHPPDIPGWEWIASVFGTAVFLYGGLVFLQGGWREHAAAGQAVNFEAALTASICFTSSADPILECSGFGAF
jgi:P-type Cu2+ transporter